MQKIHGMGTNYLVIMYLVRDFNLEYTKNAYNGISNSSNNNNQLGCQNRKSISIDSLSIK